ncbi:MAG: regulatory protein RecX [Nanoarchaeota archaeon]|nr:regulatory protein RecX [Nanoarchaeota archaeon]
MNYSPLNYALKLLERRDRSVGEVKKKMKEKEFSGEEVKKTIFFLKEKKFLDDHRFAKNFIRNQLSIKPLGKYQLKMRLKNKFISEEIVESTFDDINMNEKKLAQVALDRWIRINQSKEKKYEKVCRHLLGRGFNWEIVKEILSNSKISNNK